MCVLKLVYDKSREYMYKVQRLSIMIELGCTNNMRHDLEFFVDYDMCMSFLLQFLFYFYKLIMLCTLRMM